MSTFGKIVGANLILLLTYTLIANLVGYWSSATLSPSISLLTSALSIHVVGLLIAAIVFGIMRRRDTASSLLASIGVVLLVGFSLCFGTFLLM